MTTTPDAAVPAAPPSPSAPRPTPPTPAAVPPPVSTLPPVRKAYRHVDDRLIAGVGPHPAAGAGPEGGGALARAQERDLRGWLYHGQRRNDTSTLAQAVRAFAPTSRTSMRSPSRSCASAT